MQSYLSLAYLIKEALSPQQTLDEDDVCLLEQYCNVSIRGVEEDGGHKFLNKFASWERKRAQQWCCSRSKN